jgi:hypothetical protein
MEHPSPVILIWADNLELICVTMLSDLGGERGIFCPYPGYDLCKPDTGSFGSADRSAYTIKIDRAAIVRYI